MTKLLSRQKIIVVAASANDTFVLFYCYARKHAHTRTRTGAVDMTGIEPCKEVESVSECIVNGRMHAI